MEEPKKNNRLLRREKGRNENTKRKFSRYNRNRNGRGTYYNFRFEESDFGGASVDDDDDGATAIRSEARQMPPWQFHKEKVLWNRNSLVIIEHYRSTPPTKKNLGGGGVDCVSPRRP
jgi:hypothetical protein